ncbi:hypothetical protein D5018_11190 [Parashewanella curva]|uniref:Uncharacterized protein n=1 Tax=Parashewanella curva TaxID=2338552 RepID=A0A3L8PW76_9GAMM|nr:hypothetical protein [Parashewanella curva]RLV59606.1 hypothetical protein D5018_11190 [Parashewanella curva]
MTDPAIPPETAQHHYPTAQAMSGLPPESTGEQSSSASNQHCNPTTHSYTFSEAQVTQAFAALNFHNAPVNLPPSHHDAPPRSQTPYFVAQYQPSWSEQHLHQMGGFPPRQLTGYTPQQMSSYPQSDGRYPQPVGGYPQPVGEYPQSGGRYPQSGGRYPQPVGGYQQPVSGYPQSGGGYSQTGGGFPQPVGGYSQTGGGFPTTQIGQPLQPTRYRRLPPPSKQQQVGEHSQPSPTVNPHETETGDLSSLLDTTENHVTVNEIKQTSIVAVARLERENKLRKLNATISQGITEMHKDILRGAIIAADITWVNLLPYLEGAISKTLPAENNGEKSIPNIESILNQFDSDFLSQLYEYQQSFNFEQQFNQVSEIFANCVQMDISEAKHYVLTAIYQELFKAQSSITSSMNTSSTFLKVKQLVEQANKVGKPVELTRVKPNVEIQLQLLSAIEEILTQTLGNIDIEQTIQYFTFTLLKELDSFLPELSDRTLSSILEKHKNLGRILQHTDRNVYLRTALVKDRYEAARTYAPNSPRWRSNGALSLISTVISEYMKEELQCDESKAKAHVHRAILSSKYDSVTGLKEKINATAAAVVCHRTVVSDIALVKVMLQVTKTDLKMDKPLASRRAKQAVTSENSPHPLDLVTSPAGDTASSQLQKSPVTALPITYHQTPPPVTPTHPDTTTKVQQKPVATTKVKTNPVATKQPIAVEHKKSEEGKVSPEAFIEQQSESLVAALQSSLQTFSNTLFRKGMLKRKYSFSTQPAKRAEVEAVLNEVKNFFKICRHQKAKRWDDFLEALDLSDPLAGNGSAGSRSKDVKLTPIQNIRLQSRQVVV